VATVAFVVHQHRPEAAALATSTAAWLAELGHQVRLTPEDAAAAGLDELGHGPTTLLDGLDVAVSLGGDGTMLRAVDLVASAGVPVIGVNLGQLGYLTEVEPAGLQVALERFLDGRYEVEERMLLAVEIDSPSGAVASRAGIALNEAVIEKTPSGQAVRVDVEIDGKPFTSYATDGLIVATPTGSTAYALSARGPIVAPTHRAILLTPVSPHMLFDRTLVLEPTSRVRLEVAGHRPATVAVDGRILGELAVGDAVVCTASPHPARLVIFSPRDFHGILKAKFQLGDR
jgi:NAD+ kinase